MNLENIKIFLFDFDDTLCVHKDHAWSKEKERAYFKGILEMSEHLWDDCDINEQMQLW